MQESKQRNFRNKKDNFKEKDKEKQKVERKIHRGVFIADERRKGKGGRIKSQSIPNKIQVRMKRDVGYLHESEVEWIQVGRYNKKQGRARRKQEKKQLKYKVKQSEEKAADKKSQKKYMQKQEKAEGKDEKIQKKGQQENKSEKDLQTKQEEKEEVKQSIKADKNEESNKNQRQSDSDDSSQSDRDHKNDQTQQQDGKKQEKVMQNREQDDIVIIAQIRKQISNPFWTKPFVGVIKFIQSRSNKPQKQKYMEKSTKSSVCKILDDFSLDFQPIHIRLPICYIIKDNQMQRMFEEYVQKSFKIDYSKKGGYIRNRIMDELQNTYALVKYAETCRGKVGVSIVKIIGKAKTVDGECNCFLYQHQLNDFQHEKNEEKEQNQNLELNISPVHKQYTQLVFTIDPLTSTDLDDALSVRKISQNLYEIGIHISDVSSYIDKIPRQQIARRTTSVYLPHYVFHMLPHNLVTICSENPNVKRLAFTVFVKMNEQGQILESRIEKNLIMSRFKLAYEHAEGIIRGELPYEKFIQLHKCQQDEYKTLVQKIKTLERIGLAHRKKRLVCQIFDNDQIKFQLDEDKWPISFTVTSRISSQKIVEQFMIIGNIQAAKKSVELDPKNSLIIHHPKPSDLAVRQFNEYFKILNYKIKFENSRQLQQDLLKVQNMENIPQEVKKLCFFKARRAQQTAAYKRFSEVENSTQKVHFALDLRYYTHFTSPMRRLADILVHEVLNKVVDPKVQQKQLTQKQIQQANWGRKNTKRLKKDLNQVYFCLMIQKTGKLVEAEAIAVSFGCKSISIYVPLLDMNKQIMWSDMRVDKVLKNRTDPEKIDVIIYYDKKSSSGDIVWTVDKFAKFPIKIGCTKQIPLKINFDFEVKTNKGMKKIFPKQEW